jgi:hypothetical protein
MDMVQRDVKDVFLNLDQYGESRTIIYDGVTYENVPVVTSGLKEKDRNASSSDHAQGLYLVTSVLHVSYDDLGGQTPERGMRIKISEADGYFREFYIAQSCCELGMLRIELEAVDE